MTTDKDTNEKLVTTFGGYLQRLEKLVAEDGWEFQFRGQSKSSYKLAPSIYRNAGWIGREAEMLNDLVLRCPNEFSGDPSTFQKLAKMQHYALPTRLLDVTSNPLVALYFACEMHEDDEEENGVVFVISYQASQAKYFDSDTVCVVSNLARRPKSFQAPRAISIEEFNKRPDVGLLLHDIGQERPHFKPEIDPKHVNGVFLVKPMLENPRIIRQDGAFLLFGIDENKLEAAKLDGSFRVQRIIVDKARKKEILDRLQSLGISQATLFPDIEKVAQHIRSQYEEPDLDPSRLKGDKRKAFDAFRKSGALSVAALSTILGVNRETGQLLVGSLNRQRMLIRIGHGRSIQWKLRTVCITTGKT